MKVLVAVLLLSLASAPAWGQRLADARVRAVHAHDPPLGERKYDVEPYVVTMVKWVSTQDELLAAADARNHEIPDADRDDVRAFAILGYDPENDVYVCTITAFRPEHWRDSLLMEAIGHEMMHCFGYFHGPDF